MNPFASNGGRAAIGLIATGLLVTVATQVGTISARASTETTAPSVAARAPTLAVHATRPTATFLPVPATLFDSALGLHSGPVAVPITLEIPSIGLHLPIVGVGITPQRAMDAPEGAPTSPTWQEAFWYRGSALPGTASTALIAGHIDDPLGRPGAFARIDELRPGALIIVHDTRSGLDVRFQVTTAVSYPLRDTTDPSVVARMYGAGPAHGAVPQRSADGRSHLTLVTCAGVFDHAIRTHDHRLAVYAVRIS